MTPLRQYILDNTRGGESIQNLVDEVAFLRGMDILTAGNRVQDELRAMEAGGLVTTGKGFVYRVPARTIKQNVLFE